jgi:hypothetical protein
MDITKTILWAEVNRIIQQPAPLVLYRYTALVHTVNKDLTTMKVLNVDYIRDYANNIGDVNHIVVVMPVGEYIHNVYPYRNNLELTLVREPLNSTVGSNAGNNPVSMERYKAVFLSEENPSLSGISAGLTNKTSQDLAAIIEIKFQLINRDLEPLRIKTMGGTFNNITADKLIYGIMAGESLKILVDGKPVIDAVDVVKPDNLEVKKHVIIPHGTLLHSVPTFIQHKMGGVYNSDIGTYLQVYKEKRTWFVYPLFNTDRFKSNSPKIIFYNIPKERYTGIEKTFRVAGDTTYVIATSDVSYHDDAENSHLNSGVGFKLTDAKAMMAKPVTMTAEGPVGARANLNTEVALKARADTLNYAPNASDGISSNPFVEYSKVQQKNGSLINITWEHSDGSIIYPGQPCKLVLLENGFLNELEGVVVYNHLVIQLNGSGVFASQHKTTSLLTLFLKKTVSYQTF